ncbi:interferon lambda-3-like [Chelonia mydas]|uniref:interferon lambda-3-like n=1 Tax=Chelonia mydas TaxID=8469 RepID=UPI001CA954B2|nr:interferon lambda-3-like [Chelonia mydas]
MVNVGYKVLFALAIWTMTTEAFPKGAERTKCHLTKYKSLPPRELEAFKKAKDKFEDMMLLSDRKCSTRIFHRNWEVKELSVQKISVKGYKKVTC